MRVSTVIFFTVLFYLERKSVLGLKEELNYRYAQDSFSPRRINIKKEVKFFLLFFAIVSAVVLIFNAYSPLILIFSIYAAEAYVWKLKRKLHSFDYIDKYKKKGRFNKIGKNKKQE
ncbi:MAG: hypothetical protein ACI4I4_07345 [Acutalibacteraceae bacterium]